jgi:AraC-like DNA-binding protein
VDVVSDAVAAMRGGRPHAGPARRVAPFRRRFPAAAGAGFHVVLTGACHLTGPDGRSIVLGAGDVAFLPRGAAHTLGADADVVLMCGAYLLDRDHPHPLMRDLPDVVHVRAGNPRLRHAIDLLDGESCEDGEGARAGSGVLLPALLDVLLVQILRTWFASRSGDTSRWAAALHDPAVGTALRTIHTEPDRPWTVDKLGTRVGLSRAVFARRFTALVGQPPMAYLSWWRMTVAARLLREGDAPLAAIARRVGYASEYAFAHAFKRAFGSPPGAFRHAAASPDPPAPQPSDVAVELDADSQPRLQVDQSPHHLPGAAPFADLGDLWCHRSNGFLER